MAIFEWKDEYRIGIPALDYEHQDLFDFVNQLHDDFVKGCEKGEIEDCLGEIHARMQAHFALEEKVMRDRHYPYFAEHKESHDAFLDDFVETMKGFRSEPGLAFREELERELKNWIVDHVLNEDKKMSLMAR